MSPTLSFSGGPKAMGGGGTPWYAWQASNLGSPGKQSRAAESEGILGAAFVWNEEAHDHGKVHSLPQMYSTEGGGSGSQHRKVRIGHSPAKSHHSHSEQEQLQRPTSLSQDLLGHQSQQQSGASVSFYFIYLCTAFLPSRDSKRLQNTIPHDPSIVSQPPPWEVG